MKVANNPRRVKEMDELAGKMVGDGGSPNLYFVSAGGAILTITRDFITAYRYWRSLGRDKETMLEDRQFGVLADVSPACDDDGTVIAGGRLVERQDCMSEPKYRSLILKELY